MSRAQMSSFPKYYRSGKSIIVVLNVVERWIMRPSCINSIAEAKRYIKLEKQFSQVAFKPAPVVPFQKSQWWRFCSVNVKSKRLRSEKNNNNLRENNQPTFSEPISTWRCALSSVTKPCFPTLQIDPVCVLNTVLTAGGHKAAFKSWRSNQQSG